jgi:alkylhydroperoxidase/carboxymuconolactone decarboxylase family protein YurZ
MLTMNDLKPQAQFHINIALNLGLSEREVEHIISILEHHLGKEKGDIGRSLLANVVAGQHQN